MEVRVVTKNRYITHCAMGGFEGLCERRQGRFTGEPYWRVEVYSFDTGEGFARSLIACTRAEAEEYMLELLKEYASGTVQEVQE